MDPSQAPKAVLELASNLLSKDAPTFNSAINNSFASHASYRGHGLRIHGASNIKHTAWLFNVLDSGRNPDISPDDVKWDEATSTAHITATRFLRPSFFPLIAIPLPVQTTLKFLPDSEAADPSSTGAPSGPRTLYVTSWKDRWVFERIEERLPSLLARLFVALWAPLATLAVLFVSNLVFQASARIHSTSRHVEPHARQHLPKPVADNIDSGFQQGKRYGSAIVRVVEHLSYPPLRLLEWGIQTSSCIANSLLPIDLPTPYIFERTYDRQHTSQAPRAKAIERNEPVPATAEEHLSLKTSHARRTELEQEKNPRHVEQQQDDDASAVPTPQQGDKGSDVATDDGHEAARGVQVGSDGADDEGAAATEEAASVPERLTAAAADFAEVMRGEAEVQGGDKAGEEHGEAEAKIAPATHADGSSESDHEEQQQQHEAGASAAPATNSNAHISTSGGGSKKKHKKKGSKKGKGGK